MIQSAKILGTGFVTTGLIVAGIGIGVVFGALILGVSRNPTIRSSLFSYAYRLNKSVWFFIVFLSILLSYLFPVFVKNGVNNVYLLVYFFFTLIVGIIKYRGNYLDLLKLLLFSFKKAMFSIFNLNNLKKRLIYLFVILPLFLIVLGQYVYWVLNFLFIFNNLNLLKNFFVNRDEECLSKIWEIFFYIFLSDILILFIMYTFRCSPFLSNSEPSSWENGSCKSNEGESSPNGVNPEPNPNNSELILGNGPSSDDEGFIVVLTTLPVVEGELPVIYTDRLIVRAPEYSDLDAYYSLRSQGEAMTDSGRGKPDANISVTSNKLERLIKGDKNNVYYLIFFKNPDGSEGELIGDGGVHNFKSDSTGWPEFGYKFKKEFWGQGYATEFGKAFMQFWGGLPRKNVEIPVSPWSIDYNDSLQVKERLTAYTRNENLASQNVLLKLGFQSFEGLKNGLINWLKIF